MILSTNYYFSFPFFLQNQRDFNRQRTSFLDQLQLLDAEILELRSALSAATATAAAASTPLAEDSSTTNAATPITNGNCSSLRRTQACDNFLRILEAPIIDDNERCELPSQRANSEAISITRISSPSEAAHPDLHRSDSEISSIVSAICEERALPEPAITSTAAAVLTDDAVLPLPRPHSGGSVKDLPMPNTSMVAILVSTQPTVPSSSAPPSCEIEPEVVEENTSADADAGAGAIPRAAPAAGQKRKFKKDKKNKPGAVFGKFGRKVSTKLDEMAAEVKVGGGLIRACLGGAKKGWKNIKGIVEEAF